jgi:hypothetical protein
MYGTAHQGKEAYRRALYRHPGTGVFMVLFVRRLFAVRSYQEFMT